MIARHFRSMSVTLLLIAAAGAVVATSAWTMEVKAGRGFPLVQFPTEYYPDSRQTAARPRA